MFQGEDLERKHGNCQICSMASWTLELKNSAKFAPGFFSYFLPNNQERAKQVLFERVVISAEIKFGPCSLDLQGNVFLCVILGNR